MSNELTTSRRFILYRHDDDTGISGTGIVADGCVWPNGTASLVWRGDDWSAVFWLDTDRMERIHGHGGKTEIFYVD